MALTWVTGKFSSEEGFLGDMPIGSVVWISNRGGAGGYQFSSKVFSQAPGIPEQGGIYSSAENAKSEAWLRAAAFAEYVFRQVHGDAAWDKFMEANRGT